MAVLEDLKRERERDTHTHTRRYNGWLEKGGGERFMYFIWIVCQERYRLCICIMNFKRKSLWFRPFST